MVLPQYAGLMNSMNSETIYLFRKQHNLLFQDIKLNNDSQEFPAFTRAL